MLFANISNSNILQWLGLNKKRDFSCTVIDRAASDCDHCKHPDPDHCKKCPHKVYVNKCIPYVPHGKDTYYSTQNSFFQTLNRTQILLMLFLYSCTSDNGVVEYVQQSSLADALKVTRKTVARNLVALADLGYISFSGMSNGCECYYTITICGYADTFKPLHKGGAGYCKISTHFLSDLINAIVHESYSINTLRVVLHVMRLVLENPDLRMIPRKTLYSFLPTYARKSHLLKALELLDDLGFLMPVEDKKSISVKLPSVYDVANTQSIYAAHCERTLNDLDARDSGLIHTKLLFSQNPDTKKKICATAAKYGIHSVDLLLFGLQTIEKRYAESNYDRWHYHPSDFEHLFSKIVANKVKEGKNSTFCAFATFLRTLREAACIYRPQPKPISIVSA